MSSVSSVSSSSSSSSLYGTRNVLSGLASGLDTETMIENAVSGYKTKISSLQQDRTTAEWKQEAYRSIITKMAAFNDSYCSYTSSTNLLSAAFFNKAVTTTANGANADCVSASGKTSSDIQINGIKQLATAARYTVNNLLSGDGSNIPTIEGSEVNLSDMVTTSNISGYMMFNYGGQTISIDFSQTENYSNADELAQAITDKLGEQQISVGTSSYAASEVIKVTKTDDGRIAFSDALDAGNSVYIDSASSNIESTLGFTSGESTTEFQVTDSTELTSQDSLEDSLSGSTMKINLDGTTKSISLPSEDEISSYVTDNSVTKEEAFTALLQTNIDSSFGSGKITVNNTASDGGIKLQFTTNEGSTMQISCSTLGDALGIGTSSTSYLDTGSTLGDLGVLDGLTANADGTYDFELNGVTIGQYTADTALETVMLDIKNNTDAGVNVSYSKTTNQFVFTAKSTGEAGDINFGEGLAQKMFGSTTSGTDGTFTDGQDAIFTATINGQELSLTRSNNAVDIDGMTFVLKDEFGYDESGNLDTTTDAVTFTTTSDEDTIVDAIKNMVDDYNEMVTEIHDAYSTEPLKKSDKTKYKPLTDDDKEDMTDSAIEAYEKKAKTGLLMGDTDLTSLYSKLRSAITPTGTDGTTLRSMGITTNYSDGLTTLDLDEDDLRTMLESNPDTVKDAFTKSTDSGASTNGLMQNLKKQLDSYASITGATKGILVQKAGSELSSLSMLDNSIQDQIDNIDDEIDKWQDKLSDKIDYYTNKFTALETLINKMNSQSSALSSLLGS